jgi:hypothetical protein
MVHDHGDSWGLDAGSHPGRQYCRDQGGRTSPKHPLSGRTQKNPSSRENLKKIHPRQEDSLGSLPVHQSTADSWTRFVTTVGNDITIRTK